MLEPKDFEKYSDISILFILTQAQTELKETQTSMQRFLDRSYAIFGFYVAIFSFWISQAIENQSFLSSYLFVVILFGLLISIAFIIRNLLPYNIYTPANGSEYLMHEYYKDFKNSEQLRQFQIVAIRDAFIGIKNNGTQIRKAISYIKASIFCLCATVASATVIMLMAFITKFI